MTAPIAQKKASELIKQLNEMLHTGVNEEVLEEVVGAANKLKSIGMYSDACNVLGMVAALRMNIEEVDKFFNAAIRNSGRNIMTLLNYAVALSNAYQYQRAIEIVDEVVDMAPDDLSIIREAIDLHVNGFDAAGIRRLTDMLHRLGGEADYAILAEKIAEYEAAFSAAHTTWELVADRIGLAASAVSKLGKRPVADSYIYDGVVLFRFILDATVDQVNKAESLMVEALANEQFTSADRAIYFSCAVA